MTIGERLLRLRKERNLSQEELANALDVSRQTISKWETDQSTPDFDKIIPLCEYFGITSDELLTGNYNIKEAKQANVKSNFARNIAVAVMLYIFAIIAVVLCSAQFGQPIIGVSIFFALIAAGTGLLIYNGIYYSKEKNQQKDEYNEKDNTVLKQITSIIGTIGLIVYLLVSFLTMAWHLTWIIFIIVVLVNEIVKLIYSINASKGSVDNE